MKRKEFVEVSKNLTNNKSIASFLNILKYLKIN